MDVGVDQIAEVWVLLRQSFEFPTQNLGRDRGVLTSCLTTTEFLGGFQNGGKVARSDFDTAPCLHIFSQKKECQVVARAPEPLGVEGCSDIAQEVSQMVKFIVDLLQIRRIRPVGKLHCELG